MPSPSHDIPTALCGESAAPAAGTPAVREAADDAVPETADAAGTAACASAARVAVEPAAFRDDASASDDDSFVCEDSDDDDFADLSPVTSARRVRRAVALTRKQRGRSRVVAEDAEGVAAPCGVDVSKPAPVQPARHDIVDVDSTSFVWKALPCLRCVSLLCTVACAGASLVLWVTCARRRTRMEGRFLATVRAVSSVTMLECVPLLHATSLSPLCRSVCCSVLAPPSRVVSVVVRAVRAAAFDAAAWTASLLCSESSCWTTRTASARSWSRGAGGACVGDVVCAAVCGDVNRRLR
jgi:hypothetical protein